MTGLLKYTVVVRNPETLEAVALLEGTTVPGWAEGLVHADDLDGSDSDGGDTPPYLKWKKTDLEAEVASRNEGRDDTAIVVGGTGKVADLADALTADDIAHAGQ